MESNQTSAICSLIQELSALETRLIGRMEQIQCELQSRIEAQQQQIRMQQLQIEAITLALKQMQDHRPQALAHTHNIHTLCDDGNDSETGSAYHYTTSPSSPDYSS